MGNELAGYLIQGYFFQNMEYLGLSTVPGEGVVATISMADHRFMFSGMIELDELFGHASHGAMTDYMGTSKLSDVSLSEDKLSFIKTYTHGAPPIQYEFAKIGEVWLGSWEIDGQVRDAATCMVTPAPVELLNYHYLHRR